MISEYNEKLGIDNDFLYNAINIVEIVLCRKARAFPAIPPAFSKICRFADFLA